MSKKKGKTLYIKSLNAHDDIVGTAKHRGSKRKGNAVFQWRQIFRKPPQTTDKTVGEAPTVFV